MDTRNLVVALTVIALVASAGVALAATQDGGTTATPENGTETAGETGTSEVSAQEPTTAGVCDYESLYDETIDSVVAIRTAGGQGSGFVYRTNDSAGYVVTNAHVVESARTVSIQFTQGEARRGTVVGRDAFADLAVVRVDETPGYVEALPVADERAQHGQAVAALGQPFGLEQTISHGIVSGTNRTLPTTLGFTIPNVVQTDASINPGNSGGPLIDCAGQVRGVNTAGIESSKAENIGFAVSASLVSTIVPELIETGEFEHGFLGVSLATVTPTIAAANDLNVTGGAYIVAVADDAPAADELQGTTEFTLVNETRVPVGGDVIVAVDGEPIQAPEDLTTALFTEGQPGETVTLTVLRDDERQQVNVTLGERPNPSTAMNAT